jgi:hypothetical protein
MGIGSPEIMAVAMLLGNHRGGFFFPGILDLSDGRREQAPQKGESVGVPALRRNSGRSAQITPRLARKDHCAHAPHAIILDT